MKSTKRFFVFIMCCIMVISSIPLAGFEDLLPAVTASANDTVIYYGDLNENGRVEASDARLVLQKAASLITLTDRQMALADVNQDGRVSAMDARTVLRTAARIEAPVVFETTGTEDETDEFISIYVEFIREQGKYISTEYSSKTYRFYFCDAALCETDKNNEYPELAVVYKADIDGWDINTAHIAKIYTIKNKKVETVNSYISDYSLDTFYVWNNPKYQSDTIVVDKNMIHGGFFVAMTPTEHNIYDWGAGTASGFGYTFYNGYDAYLSAGSSYWSMFNSAIKPYVRYEFSSEKSDSIRISDIYNEEIKTFSF